MTRSISNRASMRLTASSAIGEITTAYFPRRGSVVAAVGIGLQDAAEAVKVTLGVRTGAVARRIVEGRWRRPAAKGPIVSDIGPDAPRHGLALGEDRHRGVVAVQAMSRQNVSLDQL